MAKVNLDALIQREDFEIRDSEQITGAQKATISINDLKEDEFFFSALRKPDFQRETTEWESKKILEFIGSFLDGDLIPAVIMWKSASSYIFIIDGSHRLSALAAWINNDYGDGTLSKRFYDGIIPDEQLAIAQKTRTLIHKEIGAYSDFTLAAKNPEKVKTQIAERAKRLGALAIQLQWVNGDSSKAESSFFKINQQASPIDNTELRILKARKNPNGIAARALIRSGKGHKYWSAFSEENQNTIEQLAKEVNGLLFRPQFNSPIKTLDLPVGGALYAAQSLPLVLDFINIVNGLHGSENADVPDNDGTKTINYLTRCRKIARIINSNHESSLGLHPVVYFYSVNGRHKIASFLATTALIMHFEEHRYFGKFTAVRRAFEELNLGYDYLIQQIVRKHRSALASYPHIKDFWLRCICYLELGRSVEQTIEAVIKEASYGYLSLSNDPVLFSGQTFSQETKSEVYIRQALSSALRCKICGGYIHTNSISIDHIQRKADGGNNAPENGQLTHPYCNTGVKG